MALRVEQRGNLFPFAEGLREFVRGKNTRAARAAAMNVAELLTIWGNSLTGGKWSQ